MKWINQLIILLVGGLFIFSGMVKVIDPMGTAIKLKEYFEVFANDFAGFFHAFVPFALPIAVIVVVLEVVLGVALLVNYRRRITIWALLGLILFFTFLTFYSAYFDKVTDCGCFGDFIKLSPWGSFTKDVVLLALIGWLFVQRDKFENKTDIFSTIGLGLGFIVSFGICWYALMHLPPIDFRPYKVGANIKKNMEPRGTPNIVYTFKKDGEAVESNEWKPKEEGYEFVTSEVTNQDKIEPKILDYAIMDAQGNDFTEQSLQGKKLFIVVDMLNTANKRLLAEMGTLANDLSQANIPTWVITADLQNVEQFFRQEGFDLPMYSADATVIKAMIRSNPGLMALDNGTVKGKWHFNDLPIASEVLGKLDE